MPERGRYMISVAAELAGLHPQTLRMYEPAGLVHPQRLRVETCERGGDGDHGAAAFGHQCRSR